ncbi:MAG: type VI secretion system-associated FHA domain protein TagH [Pseudomonadales bacterium]
MKLTLEVTSFQANALKETSRKEFSTAGGTLGRVVDNTWVLPDPERFLSSTHAQILYQSGGFHIKDTSTNGVFINQSKKPLGKGNSVKLNEGDVFRCGEYEFIVRIDTEAATPAPDSDPFAFELFEQRDIDPFGGSGESREVTSPGEMVDPLQLLGGGAQEADHLSASIIPDDPARSDDVFSTPEDHSSAMNDAFTPPKAQSDETPYFPSEDDSPSAAAAGESAVMGEIPEDWDKTGISIVRPAEPKSKPKQPAARQAKPVKANAPKAKTAPPLLSSAVAKPAARGQSYPAGSTNQALAAFLRGAGLSESVSADFDEQQLMELVGSLMREMLQGLMEGLNARAQIKSEFRMSQTVIEPVENNPLKFSADIDDALAKLFGPPQQGYLGPEDAIRGGIKDMAEHQLAMMVGMQAAYRHLLTAFSPEEIRARQKKGRGSAVSVFKKSQAWSDYCEYHANLVRDFDKSFQLLFGDKFASAYEDHLVGMPPELPPKR